MDTFFKKLALIPNDKLLHSFYGTVIYLLLSLFSPIFAILTVIFVAIAKEVYDEVKYKGFDIVDIVATILIPMMLFAKEVKDKNVF